MEEEKEIINTLTAMFAEALEKMFDPTSTSKIQGTSDYGHSATQGGSSLAETTNSLFHGACTEKLIMTTFQQGR